MTPVKYSLTEKHLMVAQTRILLALGYAGRDLVELEIVQDVMAKYTLIVKEHIERIKRR